MKKTLMSIGALLFAFFLVVTLNTFFGTQPEEVTSDITSSSTPPSGAAWDAVLYSDYDEFISTVGVAMPMPESINDVEYVVLRGNIGHIEFTINKIEYTYRAASASSNIVGEALYGISDDEFEKGETTEKIGSVLVSFKCTTNGDLLAVWSVGDGNYSLAVPAEERGSIATMSEILRQIIS